MRQLGERRWDLLLVSGLIVFSLALMTLQVRHHGLTAPIERFIITIVGPLQSLIHEPISAIRRLNFRLASMKSLWDENRSLKDELQRLRAAETAYQELQLKNDRLRRLLSFKEQLSFATLTASVIARDTTNWSKTITIDAGSESGIHEELPVLNHEGILGHVIRVAPYHAQVLLITDARGSVDAMMQRTRTGGVFIGSSNGHNAGVLRYVHHEEDVRVNDRVVSSGYGGIYPKGILLGVVKSVDRSGAGLFQTVHVEPAADFSRLEEVLVVLDQRPSP